MSITTAAGALAGLIGGAAGTFSIEDIRQCGEALKHPTSAADIQKECKTYELSKLHTSLIPHVEEGNIVSYTVADPVEVASRTEDYKNSANHMILGMTAVTGMLGAAVGSVIAYRDTHTR